MSAVWSTRGGSFLSRWPSAAARRCTSTSKKALYGYEGVYPATVQEFARCYAVDGVRYLNREDDAGDRGLRTSKLQYLPCKLAEKFCFDVKNELEDLDEIPTLKTERLTLSAFTDKDREAYNALCLDDERNKWWGYDYRTDWKGEDLDSYFLDVVREDFAKKRAINFAIRLDGKCIGEVLLYRFDGKGGAEEGCRIAPEYGEQGLRRRSIPRRGRMGPLPAPPGTRRRQVLQGERRFL